MKALPAPESRLPAFSTEIWVENPVVVPQSR
jgi:hypothetical protein